jgi:hypothetical protein
VSDRYKQIGGGIRPSRNIDVVVVFAREVRQNAQGNRRAVDISVSLLDFARGRKTREFLSSQR